MRPVRAAQMPHMQDIRWIWVPQDVTEMSDDAGALSELAVEGIHSEGPNSEAHVLSSKL